MRWIALSSLFFVFAACTEPRIKRYENQLEPLVNKGKKLQIGKMLGQPVKCEPLEALERCEYRTARERNDPVPVVFKRESAMGPDVSPYEYFDVLHLFYDDSGVLKEWQPIVVK